MLSIASKKLVLPGEGTVFPLISFLLRHLEKPGGAHRRQMSEHLILKS